MIYLHNVIVTLLLRSLGSTVLPSLPYDTTKKLYETSYVNPNVIFYNVLVVVPALITELLPLLS